MGAGVGGWGRPALSNTTLLSETRYSKIKCKERWLIEKGAFQTERTWQGKEKENKVAWMVSLILFICDQLLVRLTGRVRPQESCPIALLLCHHLQRSERCWHFFPSLFCLLNLSRAANRPRRWFNRKIPRLSEGPGTASKLCFDGAIGTYLCNHTPPQPSVPSIPDSLALPLILSSSTWG